jgi:formylglycine-generating enzyme required for sulfatase activity
VREVDQTPVLYSPEREWFTLAITVAPKTESGGKKPDPKTFYYTFIVFPVGVYSIGSMDDAAVRLKDEVRHPVELTRPFAVLDREVTLEELIAYQPYHQGYMKQFDAKPTDAGYAAHWYDSIDFCRWLGQQSGLEESEQAYADPQTLDEKEYPRELNPVANWAPRDWPLNLDRRGFRLPTESEWEVASRAGGRSAYGFGSEVGLLNQFGWFLENSGKHVHPPRELRPNLRGLFDLHGNLFEWTHDWYGNYDSELLVDPLGVKRGSYRVLRGGGWNDGAANCRAASRSTSAPTGRSSGDGFRLALTPSASSPEAEQAQGAEPLCAGPKGAKAETRPEEP